MPLRPPSNGGLPDRELRPPRERPADKDALTELEEAARRLSPPQKVQRPLLALVLRLGAGLALGTMLMLVKLGDREGIALAHLLLVRQATSIPLLLGWLALTSGLGVLQTRRLKAHAARAFFGTVGMVLNFLAPILLPLAVSVTLGFTSPIFAVIIAALWLREPVGRWRWTAVLLGFAGVVVIADPAGGSVPAGGAAVAIGAALMVALISNQIRDLAQTEDSLAIVVYFALFSTPVLFVAGLFFPWPSASSSWLLLLGIGVTGTVGQVLLTLALRFGQVASVIVMDYAMLIWAVIYGAGVFGALPPATLWAGAPLVIGAGVIIVWRERRLAREMVPSPAADLAPELFSKQFQESERGR